MSKTPRTITAGEAAQIRSIEGIRTPQQIADLSAYDEAARRRRMAAAAEKQREYTEMLARESAARPQVTDAEHAEWAARMVAAADAGEFDRYAVPTIRRNAEKRGVLTDELAAALDAVETA